MNFKFTESVVEIACLDYFGQLGYAYLPAPEIASSGLFAEREEYGDCAVSVLAKMKANDAAERASLPAMRVSLLPKRLSGELAIATD